MVTLGEAVKDKVASDNFQQNKNLGSTSNEIISVQEGAALSVSPKNEPVELEKIQSSSVKLSAAECNNEGNTQLKRTENSNKKQSGQEEVILSASLVKTESFSDKVSAAESTKVNTQLIKTDRELENVKPGQSSDNKLKNETNSSSRDGNPLSAIPGGAPQIIKQAPQSPSFSENEISGSSLAPTPMEVSDKSHLNPKTDADGNQTNRELIIYASIPAKPLNSLQPVHSPKAGTDGLRRDQEVRTPTRVPDKVSLDGYNWRKYGQKLVKGNEFVRSYYRCTHPNCQAKRQVERTHDGQITDTVYLGKHEHPKPQPSPRATGGSAQPIQAIKSDEPSSAVGKDKSSSALLLESCLPDPKDSPQPSTPTDNSPKTVTPQSNRTRDELDNSREPESKKQRTDISNIAETPFEKSNGESKVVVQTMSEVDIVNDGFRWRKYGQKLVKGNPNPRSYYRCSNPGCGVKKHVERASHDPKVVITTYEGHHDHGTPPCRTVTPNSSGPAPDLNGESRPKLEEKSEAPRLDIVVHIGDN